MTAHHLPVTEQSNPLTAELDMADAVGIARLLRQADAQLYSGWKAYPAMLDAEVIGAASRMARVAAEVIAAGSEGAIFLSGAGTSGRFAHLICRQFNRLLRESHAPEVFRALVAGGPMALVKAREGAEDDPAVGAEDLRAAFPVATRKALYVGITCGFSAAYVAGQLDSLRDEERATMVLLGFNPADQARDTPIEKWDKTFADVLKGLEGHERFILLNPVYGPEALTGSTRLKGATATKILLEAVLLTAMELAGIGAPEGPGGPELDDEESIRARIRHFLLRFRQTLSMIYAQTDKLGELVKLASGALRTGGQIHYLGRDTAGILGIIDASECPPTFGASPRDVRGYVRSGWHELLDEETDYTSAGAEYAIDHASFEAKKLADLVRGDLVLGIALGELGASSKALLEKVKATTKATAAVLVVAAVPPKPDTMPAGVDIIHIIDVPALGVRPGFHHFAELGLKLCLNAMTTGAHVHIGKVWHNQMIDLRISNQKLYLRAIETIQELAGVEEEAARTALLRAIHRKDSLTEDQLAAPPSAAIKAAAGRDRVVPHALLLAKGGLSFDDARSLLAQDPVVRRVIGKQLGAD